MSAHNANHWRLAVGSTPPHRVLRKRTVRLADGRLLTFYFFEP